MRLPQLNNSQQGFCLCSCKNNSLAYRIPPRTSSIQIGWDSFITDYCFPSLISPSQFSHQLNDFFRKSEVRKDFMSVRVRNLAPSNSILAFVEAHFRPGGTLSSYSIINSSCGWYMWDIYCVVLISMGNNIVFGPQLIKINWANTAVYFALFTFRVNTS